MIQEPKAFWFHTYAGVIGLEQGNLDALILEITLGLCQVKRSVVRRGVPEPVLTEDCCLRSVSKVHTNSSGR